MAYSELLDPISVIANADLSAAADQYKFVKQVASGSDTRLALAGDGEDAIGTLYVGDIAGRVCKVGIGRIIKVRLGATLAAGVRVASGSDGRATAVASNDRSLGILQQGGAAGDIVSMLWDKVGLS